MINIANYLDNDRLIHSLTVKEKARIILNKSNINLKYRNDILECAELHDIGYSEKVVKTGFHPLDGYIYLKNEVSLMVSAGILLHTQAAELSRFQDKSIRELFDNELNSINITKEIETCINIVSLSDMLINQFGETVTLEERYAQVKSKYGATDYRAITMKNSVYFYKNLKETLNN